MELYKSGDCIIAKVAPTELDKFKKRVPGSVWNAQTRTFTIPATISTYKNLKAYSPNDMKDGSRYPVIKAWYTGLLARATRLNELQIGAPGVNVEFPPDFTFVVPPFQHQREAMAYAINIPKSALWLDLGLGKTFTSINIARYRHQYNNVDRVLVVCPRSLLHQWRGEITRFTDGKATPYILEGTPAQKRKTFDAIDKDKGFLFAVITYESLATAKNAILDTGFRMFILDEATKVKNPKASRSKATVSICSTIQYGVELTGLAYLNNPVDLFSQFLALDPTVYGSDVWAFSNHYIHFVKASFGRVPRGVKNMDELKRRAYFIAFSRSKKDCLDLPDKTYQTRTLPMYDTQKLWYDKLSAELVEIEPDISVTNVLTRMEKLAQITSGFLIKDDHSILWLDSPKYKEMCEIVSTSTSSFLIWCRHAEAMKRCKDALDNYEIESAELSRRTSTHNRIQAIKSFKEGKLKVLICQITSESKGLDLTCPTNEIDVIFIENTYSIDDRWQAESRNHRIGAYGSSMYIDLAIEDTVDEAVLDALRNKYTISEYIAKMGLSIVLGKGGSVTPRKSKSKKAMPRPEDHEEIPWEDMVGLEGFEEEIAIDRRKRKEK